MSSQPQPPNMDVDGSGSQGDLHLISYVKLACCVSVNRDRKHADTALEHNAVSDVTNSFDSLFSGWSTAFQTCQPVFVQSVVKLTFRRLNSQLIIPKEAEDLQFCTKIYQM
uniref:Uncharacterized protein n=1 Tax=Daphnia galeata TaxID=27404 RepID=A0A8J2WC90_9CRUS|nr:unnamed protein product [Daphnia galeata]